jgi:hypothetical protein
MSLPPSPYLGHTLLDGSRLVVRFTIHFDARLADAVAAIRGGLTAMELCRWADGSASRATLFGGLDPRFLGSAAKCYL